MRRWRAILWSIGLAGCVLAACGEDSNEQQEADAGVDSGVEDAAAPDDDADPDADAASDAADADTGPDTRQAALPHSFGTRTLSAGQETTGCVQWTLDNDEPIYVNTVTLGNDGAFHHSNWFVVPDGSYVGDDGYFDCGDRSFTELNAAAQGTVLFAQSTQAREEVQRLPEGVVIKIPPRHKVIGSIHMLNVAPREVETDLRMQLDLIHPADVDTVVTPFRLTYYGLDIPPESESRFTGECNFADPYQERTGEPLDMKLYWALPHYHELGNYFRLEIVGGERDGEELFELSGFNAEANGQAFEPPVDLSGAEGLRFTCGFDNPRSESVGWGIGDQEMCVMLGFAESGALLDASVQHGSNEVGETRDGIVYNSGRCDTLALPKNAAQAMPTDDETESAMYIPPTDPDDEGVDPIPDCEDTPDGATARFEPTLSNLSDQVFGVGCAFSACHDTGSPAAGLDLTADDLHAELMAHEPTAPTDLAFIEPGDAEASWLYQIVSRCEPQAGGVAVAKMPKNSPTLLDPELVATLRDWIDEGAQDN